MTSAIRHLVLVTLGGALCACSNADLSQESAQSKPRPRSHQEAPSASLSAKKAPSAAASTEAPSPALSAIKPPAPTSIADAPIADTRKSDAALGADPFAHDEPGEQDMIDFDRPLDPAEVKVDRFVLAHDVQGREPLGESDTFDTDTKKIFAFVQLANPDGKPYAFRVHWEPLDGPASLYGVKLEVPTAPRFRTWSWTRIERAPGHYRAVLRTLDGVEIASRPFMIEANE